jgi:DNA-directed RNA polymerase subunit RPC12/RpoP
MSRLREPRKKKKKFVVCENCAGKAFLTSKNEETFETLYVCERCQKAKTITV